MALAFPANPVDEQLYYQTDTSGSGPLYYYRANNIQGPAINCWSKRAGVAGPNKVVNPAMQISQQNGTVGSSANTYYAADQWHTYNPASAAFTFARVAVATPRGSKYRLRLSNATTLSQYAEIRQLIEGNRIADLRYGTASARYAVLRLGMRASIPRTVVTIIANGDGSTTAYFPLAVTAVDTEYSLIIPPFTSGTWTTGNQPSLRIGVMVADGSALAAGELDVFDVGFHADPVKTGRAPEFQMPHLEDDLNDCLRYWYPAYRLDGVVANATQGYLWTANPVVMRTTPTLTVVGAPRAYDAGSAPAITGTTTYNMSPETISFLASTAGSFVTGRAFRQLIDGQTAAYIAVNARMA